MDCPKCGTAMEAIRSQENASRRWWRCPSYHCEAGIGHTTVPLERRYSLTVQELRSSMVAGARFSKSTDFQKTQTGYRRSAGALRKFAERGELSSSEHRAVLEVAELLGRFATAAEGVKKEMRRQEREEEARRKSRWAVAVDVFSTELPLPDDYKEAVPLLLAMVEQADPCYTLPNVSAELRDLNVNPFGRTLVDGREYLSRRIASMHRDVARDQANSISIAAELGAGNMARKYVKAIREAMADPEKQRRATQLVDRITAELVQAKLEAANSGTEEVSEMMPQ